MIRSIPLFESKGQDNSFFGYTFPLGENLVLRVAGGTKKGMGTFPPEVNDDSYIAAGSVLGIADGIGSHGLGYIASRTILDCLALYALREDPYLQEGKKIELLAYLSSIGEAEQIRTSLNNLVKGINQHQWNLASVCCSFWGATGLLETINPKDQPSKGIDTTIIVTQFQNEMLSWYYQGDSLLISFPDRGSLEVLTTPDFGEGYGRTGLLATVKHPNNEREIQQRQIQPGDNYLLCSDALVESGKAKEILSTIPTWYQEMKNPELRIPYAALQILEESWKSGDDATVILVRVEKSIKRT